MGRKNNKYIKALAELTKASLESCEANLTVIVPANRKEIPN
jgi:hypothetical protein